MRVSSLTDLTHKQAFVAMSILCQKGGTAQRAQGNLYAIVDRKKLTLDDVRRVKDGGDGKEKLKMTMRQFARTYADKIYEISDRYGIPGDLYKKISREHDITNKQYICWLSNFQMDNPNCPAEARSLLTLHFNSLFPTKK